MLELGSGAEVGKLAVLGGQLREIISLSQNRIAMEPLENGHHSKVYRMGKIIGYPRFFPYKDFGLGTATPGVLHQGQEVIGQLLTVLNIEFWDPYSTVLDSLYQKGQASGLIKSIVEEVLLLLCFIQGYDIAFLGAGICEWDGGSGSVQQSGLLHNFHSDEARTCIIMGKHVRMQQIDPHHQLLGLCCG